MLEKFFTNKSKVLENIIFYSLILLSFFLGRRAGDSKDRVMLLIMGLSLIQYIYQKRRDILDNKVLYLSGILYLIILVTDVSSLDYFNRIKPAFIQFSIFGILLFLFITLLDIKRTRYEKIFSLLVLFSTPRIWKGIEEFIKHGYNLKFRVTGGITPTIYSMEIGVYLVICFGLLLFSKNKLEKLLYSIYIILGSSVIVLAQSRTLLVFLPLTFIIMFFLVKEINFKNILIILGITFGIVLIGIKTSNRIEKTLSVAHLEKDPRIAIYTKVPTIEKEIFPKGLGFYYYKKQPLNTGMERVPHLHNTLAEILVTQGVIALLLYIILQVTIGFKLLANFFKAKFEDKKILIIGIGVYLFVFFTGLIDAPFYQGKMNNLEYLVLGLVFSYIYTKMNKVLESN